MKRAAVRLLASLPEVFGENLDRKDMWDRIATGVVMAAAKVSSADTDLFVQHILSHIQSQPGAAARSERLADAIMELSQWDSQDRSRLIRYMHAHLVPILVFARREWGDRKNARKSKAEIA
jgi:uncharacterized protein YlxP (DUF503 family)